MSSRSKKAGFRKLGSGIDPDVVQVTVTLAIRQVDDLLQEKMEEVARGKIKNKGVIIEILRELRMKISEIEVDPDSFERVFCSGLEKKIKGTSIKVRQEDPAVPKNADKLIQKANECATRRRQNAAFKTTGKIKIALPKGDPTELLGYEDDDLGQA